MLSRGGIPQSQPHRRNKNKHTHTHGKLHATRCLVDREHRTSGEIDPNSHHLVAGSLQIELGNAFGGGIEPVLRVLKSPLRRERAASGELLRDLAVFIGD